MDEIIIRRTSSTDDLDLLYKLPSPIYDTTNYIILDTGIKLLDKDHTYTIIVDAYVSFRDAAPLFCCKYNATGISSEIYKSVVNNGGIGVMSSCAVGGKGLSFSSNKSRFDYTDNGWSLGWAAGGYTFKLIVTHLEGTDSYKIYTRNVDSDWAKVSEMTGVEYNSSMTTNNTVKSIFKGALYDLSIYSRVLNDYEALKCLFERN